MRLTLIDYVLLYSICAFALLAPYTKVEESFNVQAIHDILFHGRDLASYDHFEFPSAVPRTFVGALAVAGLTRPFLWFFSFGYKAEIQAVARAIIGSLNAFALISLRHAIAEVFNAAVSRWFVLFSLGQFHLMFYASRPLPNMLAMPLVVFAIAEVLKRRPTPAVVILSFASIVFRLELALLTALLCLGVWLSGHATFTRTFVSGLSGLALGAATSLAVDSYFSQEFPMLPEIHSFIFNVVDGQSALWGTEPYSAYFLKHLPNIVTNPLLIVLAPFGFLRFNREPASGTSSLRVLLLSAISYVAIYSIQPHKEWRFVIYIVPILTMAASVVTTYLYQGRSRLLLWIPLGVFGSTCCALLISFAKLSASSVNYPGGVALKAFHGIVANHTSGYYRENVTVHMDVFVCMTGASRFGQLYDEAAHSVFAGSARELSAPYVVYDKTEDDGLADLWSTFDYIITEISPSDLAEALPWQPLVKWQPMAIIEGLDGFNTQLLLGLALSLKEYLVEIGLQLKGAVKADGYKGAWQVVRQRKFEPAETESSAVGHQLIRTLGEELRTYGLRGHLSQIYNLVSELVVVKPSVWIYRRTSIVESVLSYA